MFLYSVQLKSIIVSIIVTYIETFTKENIWDVTHQQIFHFVMYIANKNKIFLNMYNYSILHYFYSLTHSHSLFFSLFSISVILLSILYLSLYVCVSLFFPALFNFLFVLLNGKYLTLFYTYFYLCFFLFFCENFIFQLFEAFV